MKLKVNNDFFKTFESLILELNRMKAMKLILHGFSSIGKLIVGVKKQKQGTSGEFSDWIS